MVARVVRSVHRGFTVIELMTVVAILSILALVAAPSLTDMLRAQKVKTLSSELFDDIVFARSEAIKRNGSVTLTPKDTTSGSTKDWAKGWDITTTFPAAMTLKSREAANGDTVGTGPNTLSLGAAGRPTTGAGATFAITQTGLSQSKWRCISVDLSGRPVSKAGACS